MKLKPKTKEIFRFICNYWIENRCSPSMRDIVVGVESVTSTCVVETHLMKLRDHGLIEPKGAFSTKRNIIPTDLKVSFDWLIGDIAHLIYYSDD